MIELLKEIWNYPAEVGAIFIDRMVALGWPLYALEISGSIFWMVMVFQIVYTRFTGRFNNIWEPLANLSINVTIRVLGATTLYGILVIGVFLVFERVQLFNIPLNWSNGFICLLLTDFCYYWYHRSQHRIRILWGIHNVHHSSEEFDLSTGVRIFIGEDLIIWVYFAPLVLFGFDAALVLTCMWTTFAWAAWQHIDNFPKVPILDAVFSTPSNHRVHHGSNRQYLDKNYGGILIIWDRLFGTYAAEVEPVRYGLTKPLGTSDPLRITLNEFIAIAHDVKQTPSWRDKLGILLKPPGWRPRKTPQQSEQ